MSDFARTGFETRPGGEPERRALLDLKRLISRGEASVAELQAVIAALQADVTSLQADVTSLQADVVAAEEQLSDLPQAIQANVEEITTNGSGLYSVTFPEAFVSAPVMSLPSVVGTNVFYSTVFEVTTTGFSGTIRNITTGNTFNSSSTDVRWVAIGTLA